ncbi:NAD(P)-binding domain-containing protein [Streptomyces sp. NPDC050698]
MIAIHPTGHPDTCRRLEASARACGVALLDAPVSGSGWVADQRSLVVMAGRGPRPSPTAGRCPPEIADRVGVRDGAALWGPSRCHGTDIEKPEHALAPGRRTCVLWAGTSPPAGRDGTRCRSSVSGSWRQRWRCWPPAASEAPRSTRWRSGPG